ncbi:MAG: acyl-CoA dehydrogenase family protein [Microthrixaceae bacterium]|nr:acyl-CoA dehydrogenase family protein [Microthrixaceae bacterium]MCB1012204.1 acyl-CoA dehydrogenase family protein [Microthrixaceae bacterium]MCB9386866.1 acyl-CoA dehydrogenase family protein [Microthrixaceae bacterium]MCO5321248.1 acyl-CoA dehydrogenase family protein [Microthrixaceae bacterium]
MDFEISPRARELTDELQSFMDDSVYPAEAVYEQQMEALGDPHGHPRIVEDLKTEARSRGLWNLFMPHRTEWTPDPVSNLDYAHLAEISGRSMHLAPEAMNCAAPDTGNMEVLALFGSPAQQDQWLQPLLAGEIRSAFAMTEPDVASSDATNIQLSIQRDGDEYVLNGRKWWISGAASERCKVFIVMGKTDPEAPRHTQQSMILVPRDTEGLTVVRDLPVFGYQDREGHVELRFDNVRVPAENLIGEEGSGFAIAQARLGPGRIHHCMRCIGVAERALELMCRRVTSRVAFGRPLADQGVIREWIADSRMEIEQARLLTLKAAWLMDTVGSKGAAIEISSIKVIAPNVALRVVDRSIQAHGGGGVSDDFPLARMYAGLRTLRFADGPDEVHRRQVARTELARHSS